MYNIFYQQLGSSHFTVRNITLKRRLTVQNELQRLDVDYNQKYLTLLTYNNKRVIEFHELATVLDGDNESVDLKTPYFCLKFMTDIHDYYFNKNGSLEHLAYKNFLIVQTTDALIIYRESERHIMKKVFSLDVVTVSPSEARFKFLFLHPNRIEHSIFELVGCFLLLQNNTLSIYYVRNLETRQQTIVADTFKMVLAAHSNSEMVSVKAEDVHTTEICTYTPNFIVAKYVVSSADGKRASRIDSFKLLTRSIDSNNFVYNHKNKYVYGNLKHKEMGFMALKHKYEAKFYYKIVLPDREHFLSSFWALVNKSVFVKINVNSKSVKLFRITPHNTGVVVSDKKQLDMIDNLGAVRSIRFVLLNKASFITIVEDDSNYVIIYFEIDAERFVVVDLLFNLQKSELTSSKPIQYALVQWSKAERVYKFIISDETNFIRTFLLKAQSKEVILVREVAFKSPVLEFYKSAKFPHDLVVLTRDNNMSFFDIDLAYLADFDISALGVDVRVNPNNFQLKHLYDGFFIVS